MNGVTVSCTFVFGTFPSVCFTQLLCLDFLNTELICLPSVQAVTMDNDNSHSKYFLPGSFLCFLKINLFIYIPNATPILALSHRVPLILLPLMSERMSPLLYLPILVHQVSAGLGTPSPTESRQDICYIYAWNLGSASIGWQLSLWEFSRVQVS